jgi:hypothetical protein
VFISDGSTNLYQYVPSKSAWSTLTQVVGGAGAIGSLEVSAGTYRLMTGRTAGSGYILARDTSTWQDDGSSYTCFGNIGSLALSQLGNTVDVDSVLIERMPTGTDATVSVLLNEVSGSFTTLPNPVPEPPLLAAASTIISKRHYFKSAATPLPQKLRHMQIKVAFSAENFQNELLGVALLPLIDA